ncbi:MAG: AarF/ABC1/UbiB kinase family protein [Maricaulaceae bacterium]|jgi:predicted unusual protein kinase regulating ubiquinone biosynthesis (AarF/ABC1/UbiB family)
MPSDEADRFSGRALRVARVGAGLSTAALTIGANRLLRGADADPDSARALKAALGGFKGPLMKVAQMMATIPDFLPESYAEELAGLQTNAPPMGWSFVKRRMRAELGPDWQARFSEFEREAAHAASLGQVHKARDPDGRALAVKLQYPDMASAVEADLGQLKALLGVFKRVEKSIDPDEMFVEIAARLREELDYVREAKAIALYGRMLKDAPGIAVPEPVPELSTGRLLAMTWLEGEPITAFKSAPQEVRNRIATRLCEAWWRPLFSCGVIHGDPHLGNYAVADPNAETVNVLDFGCIRIFPPRFVEGVVTLYHALKSDDRDGQAAAYEAWGFASLSNELLDALNIWARFIYGPLLDDRKRTVADGMKPSQYGRKEAFAVRTALREHGPVRAPREFVFMDRAAIGLGAAFLRLDAKLNFHDLYNDVIGDFHVDRLAAAQSAALAEVGLEA